MKFNIKYTCYAASFAVLSTLTQSANANEQKAEAQTDMHTVVSAQLAATLQTINSRTLAIDEAKEQLSQHLNSSFTAIVVRKDKGTPARLIAE